MNEVILHDSLITSNNEVGYSKKEKFSSSLIVFVVVSKMMNIIVGTFLPQSFPTGIVILGIIWICFLVYFLKYIREFNSYIYLISAFLLLFFIISIIFVEGNHAQDLFIHFVEYGLLGLLVSNCKFSIRLVLKYSTILNFICIIPTIIVFRNSIINYRVLTMSISYIFFPLFLATIMHMIFYFEKKYIFSYLSSIIFMIFTLLKGTRGIVVCFIVSIMLIYIIKSIKLKKSKIRSFIFYLVLIFSIIIVLSNIVDIIVYINTFLTSKGITIRFFQDSVETLMTKEDITDGRNMLYSYAIKGFLDSPIYGNGIGNFNNVTSLAQYPHNGILQLLYEGGLLLASPILMILAKSIILFFKKNVDNDYKVTFIFLFCIAIIPSMFSDEIWLYQSFWLLIGYIINYDKITMRKKRNA